MEEPIESNLSSPEEHIDQGLWTSDFITYNLNRSRNGQARIKTGTIYKSLKTGEITCFKSHNDEVFNISDNIFIESSQTDPYIIGCITSFKMVSLHLRPTYSKKDQLQIKLNRYYRPTDVPEMSYNIVCKDREERMIEEISEYVKTRELFSSDYNSSHSITSLRYV
uniref:BAH domain-containing protein n=1 Tax=Rhabditophanes sp. KR3021 TaxID=114890 RepID=A0AC35U670_9BILA